MEDAPPALHSFFRPLLRCLRVDFVVASPLDDLGYLLVVGRCRRSLVGGTPLATLGLFDDHGGGDVLGRLTGLWVSRRPTGADALHNSLAFLAHLLDLIVYPHPNINEMHSQVARLREPFSKLPERLFGKRDLLPIEASAGDERMDVLLVVNHPEDLVENWIELHLDGPPPLLRFVAVHPSLAEIELPPCPNDRDPLIAGGVFTPRRGAGSSRRG